MNEKLSDLLERGTPQSPPLQQMATNALRLGRRRQLRRRAGTVIAGAAAVGAVLLTPTVLDAVHQDAETDSVPFATQTPTQEPSVMRLTCPSNEMLSAPGPYWATVPKGFGTRTEAVDAWLRASLYAGSKYQMAPSGDAAYVLRDDGTAVASLTFMESNGFLVDGVLSCG